MKQIRLLFALLLFTLPGVAVGQNGDFSSPDAIRRGNERFSRGEYQLAIQEYGKVSPDSGETYATSLYNTGVCFYELWNTREAIIYYRKAVAARLGSYPAALHALGVALRDQGQIAEAKQAIAQSIRTSGGSYAPAHYLSALIAMSEGDHERAAAAFKRSIEGFKAERKDRFPAGHNNLGVALARMGRLAEARREFETALRQSDGQFEEATYNLKLCSSLLAQAPVTLASLKTIEAHKAPEK